MTASLGFFRAEGRTEAVDFAEGQRTSLGVELAALRQVGFALAEIIDFEQVSSTLTRSRRQYRRVEEHKTALMKKLATSGLDFTTHSQDCMLPGRSYPQVAHVE